MDVIWQPKAVKQLKKIGEKIARERILNATRGLADFPDITNVRRLKNHEYGYRLRVGNWRIFF